MQLQAVLIPPIEVLQDVLDATQSIRLVPVIEEPRPGMLERLLRRETPAAPPPHPTLTVVPSEEAFVRLARLGSVAVGDALNFAEALGVAARTWSVPVVHVAGLVIDTTVPRPVITAQLGGDTDGLLRISASIQEVGKQRRFFLDRRSFQPEFTVAAVDLPDDPSLRERIVFDAQDHRGPDWQATHISMVRASFDSTSQSFAEVASVPVGDAS